MALSAAPLALAAPPAGPSAPSGAIDAFVPIVRSAQYVGGRAELRGNLRWLVVASRPSYGSAVDYAQQFSSLVAPCVVVQSQNGWYAILAGVLDMPKAELNLDNLKGVRLIPQDSYLSTGAKFHTVVWTGYGRGTHDVMDQRALRSTVRRMQTALREAGFYSDAIDGLLGRKTVRAYQAYERASGTGRRWGESSIGPAELARMEGYASERRTRIARERAAEQERQRIARAEAERRRQAAMRTQLAAGEWHDLNQMEAGQAAGFGNGVDYRDARREGITSQSLYAEFQASDFTRGRDFLDARGRGFGTKREFDRAEADGWRDAAEMTAGLADGYATGDDYRASRRGGFQSAEQYVEATQRGFRSLSAMERADRDGHRTMAEMTAAREGGFENGASYRAAVERGFQSAAQVAAAERAGFKRAEPWRLAREAGFATKAERDDATGRGFETAAQRDEAEALGFETAASHAEAVAGNWRDAAERERGTRIGFEDGDSYRQAMAGGFAHAEPYARATARGFARQSDVLEADRLGYRTARSMERGVEGGFRDGEEYRAASSKGFALRADWLRAGEGGFPTARDLSDADRGGFRDMPELVAGRDGGFGDAAALRAARDAGFTNAAQVARAEGLGYRSAVEMRAGEDGGFRDANAYRAARTRGFESRVEMARAASAGFDTAGDRDAAAAKGFQTLAALEAARADGFDRADDHRAFRASGFGTREAFLRARERGHVTMAAALEDAVGRLDDAEGAARNALDDADLFVRLSKPSPSLVIEIVTGVTGINDALGAEIDREDLDAVETALASLDGGTARLLQSLGRDAAFAAFHARREAERGASATQRLADARKGLEATREATFAWAMANITHPGAGPMLAHADEIDAALASDDADAIEALDETVRLAAAEYGADLSAALAMTGNRTGKGSGDDPLGDVLVGEGPAAVPPDVDPIETGAVPGRAAAAGRSAVVAVTDSNRFLVEGPDDGVVALYNVGLDEPRVGIDILGDVRFAEGRARACGVGVDAAGERGRHLRAVLREAGVATLDGFETCTAGSLDRVDLVIARRGDFLVGNTTMTDRVLGAVERSTLRRFDPVTTEALAGAAAAEATLVAAIEVDLAAGARRGFGAVALAEHGPFCAVANELTDHAAPLAAEPVAAERLGEGEATPLSLNTAYLASQRGGCATIYASGNDLATLVAALERDGRDHAVLPFWINDEVVEAERGARETARLERERAIANSAREAEARAAIATEREAELATTLQARTAALREANGPQARELAERLDAALDDMVANCRGCAAGEGDDATALFPALASWHAARTRGDDWEVRDLAHEIVEYGDVDHEGRAIRAIVMRVDFDLASPGRGARTRECHTLAAAWDGEFARWRDPVSAPCGDAAEEAWTRGYALTSLWTASEGGVGDAVR